MSDTDYTTLKAAQNRGINGRDWHVIEFPTQQDKFIARTVKEMIEVIGHEHKRREEELRLHEAKKINAALKRKPRLKLKKSSCLRP